MKSRFIESLSSLFFGLLIWSLSVEAADASKISLELIDAQSPKNLYYRLRQHSLEDSISALTISLPSLLAKKLLFFPTGNSVITSWVENSIDQNGKISAENLRMFEQILRFMIQYCNTNDQYLKIMRPIRGATAWYAQKKQGFESQFRVDSEYTAMMRRLYLQTATVFTGENLSLTQSLFTYATEDRFHDPLEIKLENLMGEWNKTHLRDLGKDPKKVQEYIWFVNGLSQVLKYHGLKTLLPANFLLETQDDLFKHPISESDLKEMMAYTTFILQKIPIQTKFRKNFVRYAARLISASQSPKQYLDLMEFLKKQNLPNGENVKIYARSISAFKALKPSITEFRQAMEIANNNWNHESSKYIRRIEWEEFKFFGSTCLGWLKNLTRFKQKSN